MKKMSPRIALATSLLAIVSPAFAEGPSANELKPEQVANVLKQLEELEKTILAQRGTNLTSVIQRIHAAAASDGAAQNFIADCDRVVNVDRKLADREAKQEAERRKDQQKKRQEPTKGQEEKNGDTTLALRLSLEYLALTLEANEAKDITVMIPKLQSFHQSLQASAPKLKGQSAQMLHRSVSMGEGRAERGRNGGATPGGSVGLVVSAFQLERYLSPENWSGIPADIIGHFDKGALKLARENKPEEVASLWETAINLEAAIRKETMFDGEYAIWVQNELPSLRWRRAEDMVEHGPSKVAGLAEMLNVIKANPTHADSPTWVRTLRSLVKPDEAAATDAAPAAGVPVGATDGSGAGK